ncbi:MAG: hypothetical protein U1F09_16550 [Steroidobacteraceae bacterium]
MRRLDDAHRHRVDEHDRAAALLLHQRHDFLAQLEEPKTLTSKMSRQPSRSSFSKVLKLGPLKALFTSTSTRPRLLLRGLDQLRAVLLLRDVRRDAQRTAAGLADLGRDLLGPSRRARRHQVRTLAREASGYAAHAGSDLGDDRNAVLEQHVVPRDVVSSVVSDRAVGDSRVDRVQLSSGATPPPKASIWSISSALERAEAHAEVVHADVLEPAQVRRDLLGRAGTRVGADVERGRADVEPLAHGADLDRGVAELFRAVLADGCDGLQQLGARGPLRQPAVTALGGALQRRGRRAADPDRRTRPLRGRGATPTSRTGLPDRRGRGTPREMPS